MPANGPIETRDSIAEIATSLGYISEYAFAAAFKREMGCPPRRYVRQTCRGPRPEALKRSGKRRSVAGDADPFRMR
ncbi:helix-turn-helix domain-containing protein [Xaviernesmea oryzae]|uniref:helix-turn-helix domain-containing protein n=1 Tax=Xaviernesmea oryzae TaxID=464029 RepID=UPI001F4702CF|nr:AraC family transcriptional regulator [Xaviernesmea oryzae]